MSNFDWSKCIFCQRIIPKVKTVGPFDSKRSDVGCGYTSLADAVSGFRDIGQLPLGVNFEAWDEGDGLESTCRRRHACWHASCRQKLHGTKLDRLRSKMHALTTDRPDDENVEQDCETSYDCDVPCKVPRLTRNSISNKKQRRNLHFL
jgi:hypothetical protein